MDEKKEIALPISVLSYSSLTRLLRNPIMFKLVDILGVYDTPRSMSSMIGSAGHDALKLYYGGNKDIAVPADPIEARTMAIEHGYKYLENANDAYINYGKTGSREQMLKGFSQAMNFYFAEEPKYHNILMCEEKMNSELRTLSGDLLPLPAVGIPDIVDETPDGVDIVDVKFVTQFTDHSKEDYLKIIQAQFLFHLLLATKGIKARRVLFREVKRTLNVDPRSKKPTGKPQIQDYAVPCDHEPYHIIFYNLYNDVVKYLRNDPIFLPNITDPMDGEHAGMIYAQGLLSADMSDVEVMHRVREVALTSKKFVASRLDRAENANLLPEERIKVLLLDFGIPLEPQETIEGASVTQYRFRVSAGVSMTKIKKHKDDIVRALKAKGEVRLLTPIAGTDLLGIEVEREKREPVKLSPEHFKAGTLSLPIGIDVNGNVVREELDKMPHLLVAGATGSGKSVEIGNFITALTQQLPPEQLKLLLIDPKRVELKQFAKLPHVVGKVLYEYEDVVRALVGLVAEMETRYKTLEEAGKRDIGEFNGSKRDTKKRLPYIVAVMDEFADLILTSKAGMRRNASPSYGSKSKRWLFKELVKRGGKLRAVYLPVEDLPEAPPKQHKIGRYGDYTKDELADMLEAHDSLDPVKNADVELLIIRLAAMARAVGIHLILATQRPSADVITGLIKANFPTRIALTTSSPTDSIVILGVTGAEKLAGKGDMIFLHPAAKGQQRLQAFYR